MLAGEGFTTGIPADPDPPRVVAFVCPTALKRPGLAALVTDGLELLVQDAVPPPDPGSAGGRITSVRLPIHAAVILSELLCRGGTRSAWIRQALLLGLIDTE